MNGTAEIDKAGRLVVPKKLREALHLAAGTRLSLRTEGECLVVQAEAAPRGLYLKRGTLVYDPGPVPPTDAVSLVNQDREARLTTLLNNHGLR